MRDLVVVVALAGWLAGGCAAPLSAAIPAYPTASQLEVDAQACEHTATGRAEFERRADYMACMIAQGYRTYVSVATYWNMAELTVGTGKKQPDQAQVRLDLQACATEAGAVAGAKPLELAEAVEWVNVKVLRRERGRDDTLGPVFAQCLTKRGYSTRPVNRVAAD